MDAKLRYVYMVYKEKSFTRAAERLYISQPSLSAMVKKAEQEFGAIIFDRTSSPLELTQAGQAYIEYIERVSQCEDTLNEKLWDIQNLGKGSVRLGGSNYVLSSIVPLILRQLMPRYPGIQIELIEEKSSTLRRMIQEKELDLVIDSFYLEDEALVYHHLLDEQILLAIPEGDEANERLRPFRLTPGQIRQGGSPSAPLPAEEIRQLLARPFILLKPENDMFRQAKIIFDQFDRKPEALLQLDQLVTSLQYTEAALGCSFVTDTLFRYGDWGKHIYLYAVGEQRSPSRELCIVHKRGKYVSNPCRLLIQTAQQVFSARPAGGRLSTTAGGRNKFFRPE
jgi:DNA-binding transcriptional LysR family regulator